MGQRKRFYQWFRSLAHALTDMPRPHVKVLAMFSIGLALAGHCALPRVARCLAGLGSAETVERRLHRFLGNPLVDPHAGAVALTRWVLRRLRHQRTIVLLVDETHRKDRLRAMAVGLAYQGRALPLAWRCYHPNAWPKGQVDLIDGLLRQVKQAVPEGTRVVVQADRGIGTSPELLRRIGALGWHYLVRVQGTVRVRCADGREVALRHLVPAPGSLWRGPVWAFKKGGWLPCYGLGWWAAERKEPWLLLANLPGVERGAYGVRMWQELGFRDLKRMGWQWEDSKVWDPERADRLWLVFAVAYAWMVTLGSGKAAQAHPRRERHSVFQRGLHYFRQAILTGRRLCYGLAFPLPPIPLPTQSVGQ